MLEVFYNETHTGDADRGSVLLPKNFRQVGTPGDTFKIYIEDYVITYLNQISGERPYARKVVVLLGKTVKKDQTEIMFIHGAIHVPAAVREGDRLAIDSETWTGVYETIQTYFHDCPIAGWFLCAPGRSAAVDETVEKLHKENFSDKGKIFYTLDPSDKEDAFYVYQQSHLERQHGYYIYYERNEDMQNYMIEHKKAPVQEVQNEASGFTGKYAADAIKNMRSRAKQHPVGTAGAHTKNLIKIAVLLLVCVAAAGIRYRLYGSGADPLRAAVSQRVESSTSGVQGQSGEDMAETGTGSAASMETVTSSTDAESMESTPVSGTLGESGQQTPENTEKDAGADAVKESERVKKGEADRQAAITAGVYTVKTGDTLISICRALYSDTTYVDRIISLNNIEDADKIYPGMEIKLP